MRLTLLVITLIQIYSDKDQGGPKEIQTTQLREERAASKINVTALACAGREDSIVKEIKEKLALHWTKGRVPLW